MPYERKLSTVERYYVSCDTDGASAYSPCVNQVVIDGHGDITEQTLRSAVSVASASNPGSRLMLEGHLGFSRWVAAFKTCRFTVIHDSKWDGCSDLNAGFLFNYLPVREGVTSEVVFIPKAKNRFFIIFRTHHGTMDGRGTQHFIQDVFRILNNQKPLGENSVINDIQLATRVSKSKKSTALINEVKPITNPVVVEGKAVNSRWLRKTIQGKHKGLLGKVALEIARYGRSQGCEDVRIQLPVDMRPHVDGIRSTANLTGGIVIDVPEDMTLDGWNSEIRSQIAQKKEAEVPRFFKIIPFELLDWIPLSVMKKSNQKLVNKRRISGRFRTSGIISNLGRLSLKDYTGGGFVADCVFFIPPEFDTTALFVTLTGHENGIEFLMRIPDYLDGGQLEDLMDSVLKQVYLHSEAPRKVS